MDESTRSYDADPLANMPQDLYPGIAGWFLENRPETYAMAEYAFEQSGYVKSLKLSFLEKICPSRELLVTSAGMMLRWIADNRPEAFEYGLSAMAEELKGSEAEE